MPDKTVFDDFFHLSARRTHLEFLEIVGLLDLLAVLVGCLDVGCGGKGKLVVFWHDDPGVEEVASLDPERLEVLVPVNLADAVVRVPPECTGMVILGELVRGRSHRRHPPVVSRKYGSVAGIALELPDEVSLVCFEHFDWLLTRRQSDIADRLRNRRSVAIDFRIFAHLPASGALRLSTRPARAARAG